MLAVGPTDTRSLDACTITSETRPRDTPITFTFTGGSGLNHANSGDAVKVVASGDTCAVNAAGGTSAVADIPPDNFIGQTTSAVPFTFTTPGSYKPCYQLAGGVYASVGSVKL